MSQQRIVVGIDGSDASKEALRWAIGQATRTAAIIEAVISWNYPAIYALGTMVPDYYGDCENEATETLDKVIAEVAGPDPGVDIVPQVIWGLPAQTLLDAAKDADLLVVGSRGRGGFKGLLLGSVSSQCVQHAACPVVVIRGAD